MTPEAGFPFKRIALAVILSILAHSLLFWKLPEFKFTLQETPLPPLQARLEPLPELVKKYPVARKPKPPPSPPPVAEPAIAPVPEVADVAASAVPADIVATSTPEPTEPLSPEHTAVEETVKHPLLPRHAQLHYTVQYGSGTFKVGEVSHTLENIDGHYSLHAETETTGLVSIFKSYKLTQTSTGTVSKSGLRPDSYTEIRKDASGTQTSTASFNWNTNSILFADGQRSTFQGQAQDVLSLPYQLSQLTLNQESIAIALSNGKNIRQQYIAIGDEGIITTPMGELRTIALHKVHGANEDGLIIWLALEYRLLPVKILYLDKSGDISANMVITDIRVSDK